MQEVAPFIIAGPCAIENRTMFEDSIRFLDSKDIHLVRAGLYKPRTNPHTFQGLGTSGISILAELKREYPVSFISEILDVRDIEKMREVVDVFQVGSRNMSNYVLLKELGKAEVPVLLKRNFGATLHEFACAAEYLTEYGSPYVVLCERGIRSFDTETRNLLDLSCVPLMKSMTALPVIVDISHSLGRKVLRCPWEKQHWLVELMVLWLKYILLQGPLVVTQNNRWTSESSRIFLKEIYLGGNG